MIGYKASIALSAVVIVLAGAAMLAKGRSAAHAERERTLAVAQAQPVRDVSKQPFSETPDPPPPTVALSEPADEIDPMMGLSVMKQSFRRGGLGSKVMTTFTLVNANEFPVKDVAMRCEFAGQDGRYISSRQRVVAETVKQKSRKRVGPTLVGFVNVTLSQARCTLASAARA